MRHLSKIVYTEPNQEDQRTQTVLVKSDAVRHGFMVVGRILAYCTRAYMFFCQENQRDVHLDELIGLLSSDQVYDEFTDFLSQMPNQINRVFEENYELTTDSYRFNYGKTHFIVSQKNTGELYIHPDEVLEDQAYRLCPQTEKSFYGEFAYCPANIVLLPKLWQHMIDLATSEGILENELGFHTDIIAG